MIPRAGRTFGFMLGRLLLTAVTVVAVVARLGRAGGTAVAGVRAAVRLGLVSRLIGWTVGAMAPLSS